MDDEKAAAILKKLKEELDPEYKMDDWDFDLGFELAIERAIYIVKEVMGYDVGESSGNS